MCGVYGEYVLRDGAALSGYGERATDALEHRGPDDRGTWSDSKIFVGMRRLSIIDLSSGHQPIWNEDETCCIVYNGELYNFLDLRPQLEARGHVFRTNTDTEVVLHAYEEWGTGCLRRFNGMFAFAIWDGQRQTLLLARDRIGEKPLYYYRDDERLVFASEIKAIIENPAIPRRVSQVGLRNYLAFGHSVAPETMFEGILKLLPGHYLQVSDGDETPRSYWDVGDEPNDTTGRQSFQDSVERVRTLLDDSVRRRMIADVPVGAFLSGGVDSSAIAALMQRHATGPVKTFSLGFTIGGAYNELSDARRVASFLGTEHHELNVEHVDLVQTLRTLVYHYDEPFGDDAAFPVYLLSRFARQHVKVVLSGDGGDELFGGYRRYAADQVSRAYQKLPGVFTDRMMPALVRRLPRLRRIKRTVETLPVRDPGERYARWLMVFGRDMRAGLLHPDVVAALPDYDPSERHRGYYGRLNGTASSDHLNRLMYVDVKTLLVDAYMEKLDKATMACSLEGRLPFLDPRLVEVAFQMPSKYKIQGWSTKRVLKAAVSDWLPKEVLQKRKHGFAVPIDPWFRGELSSFAFEVLLDGSARRRGYFNSSFVEQLWREHNSGRHVWDTHLWLLLNFELWHRTYLDRQAV